MFESFVAGVVLGLSAGLSPGPLLTLVVTQTLRHGTGEGVKVALAPLVTDLPVIAGAVLLSATLQRFHHVLGAISLAGGFYVLYLAYESLTSGPVSVEPAPEAPHSVRRGAVLNVLNPNPYIFWTTVGGPFVVQAWHQNRASPLAFLSGFYICLVGAKVLVALLTGVSRGFLISRGYLWIMRGLGVLLAILAVVLVRKALTLWGV